MRMRLLISAASTDRQSDPTELGRCFGQTTSERQRTDVGVGAGTVVGQATARSEKLEPSAGMIASLMCVL